MEPMNEQVTDITNYYHENNSGCDTIRVNDTRRWYLIVAPPNYVVYSGKEV